MKKPEKYNTVQELKATTTNQKVSAAIVEERYREFASFIHFLRGDEANPSLANHTPENKDLDDLITEKQMLGREKDLKDIEQLKAIKNTTRPS